MGETGLDLEYSMGKGEFIAKEQGRGGISKCLRENICRKEGLEVDRPKRTPAEGRPG